MLFFILGSCLGSFFCLAIERGYQKKSLLFPASQCSHCQMALKPYELIPVFSILFLRFRCRYCHSRLPFTYFFSEIAFGGLFYWYLASNLSFHTSQYFIWLGSGLLLCLTDLFYYYVEPKILYPATITMLILAWLDNRTFNWQNMVLLALIFFILLRIFPKSFGDGDIKLLICWSFFLTTYQLSLLLFFASLFGLITFLLFTLVKSTKKKLPFVPFLWAALLLVLFLT